MQMIPACVSHLPGCSFAKQIGTVFTICYESFGNGLPKLFIELVSRLEPRLFPEVYKTVHYELTRCGAHGGDFLDIDEARSGTDADSFCMSAQAVNHHVAEIVVQNLVAKEVSGAEDMVISLTGR